MQDDKIVNSSTENPLKNENIDNVLKDLPKEKREVIYSAFYAIERSNVRFSFRRVTMNIIFYVNLHAERF